MSTNRSYPQLKDLWLSWDDSKHQCDTCGIFFEGSQCPYCGINYSVDEEEDLDFFGREII